MFEREYTFRGKHAKYVKDLVDKDKAELFNRNIDVYILAPIIGFLYGRKGKKDTSNDTTTKIFTEQLLKEQTTLKFIYRLIMLLDESNTNLSSEDKINRAFRESNEDKLKKNMEIYDSYVLGGVEHLHEKLYEENLDRDDYINKLFEFVKDFKDDLESRISEENIEEIISKYE